MTIKYKGQKFNVVYADPPWAYKNTVTGGSKKSSSNSHYETLSYMQLQDLSDKLDTIVADDAVMFMWATTPLLEYGVDLMQFWGYDYKTVFVWIKEPGLGMGNYFRINTEFLLVGIRGNVKPFKLTRTKNYAAFETGKHSMKPDWFRNLIVMATKNCFSANVSPKYIELFARTKYIGWETLGREISGESIEYEIEKIRRDHKIK